MSTAIAVAHVHAVRITSSSLDRTSTRSGEPMPAEHTCMKKSLTAKAAAEALGISDRWLRELATRGIIPRQGKGKQVRYPWPEARDAYHEHLRDQGREERTLVDLNAERAELTRVKRLDAELELARKRQELITVADATAIVGQALDMVRARLLNLPGRLGPELVGVTSIPDAVERLDRAVREILTTLQGIAEHVDDPESNAGRGRA
jgi:phage terminase Nu1 subunit (DNA packaging protein)